jgi:hypothetical protein
MRYQATFRRTMTAVAAITALAVTAAPALADVINGNDNDNTITGTAGADTISGNGGDDKLWGGDGNDELYGGTGADVLHGEDGVDRLFGGLGRDASYGGNNDDLIFSDTADDTAGDNVFGGAGNDTIWTRDGDTDWVTCGDGPWDLAILDNPDVLAADSGCERVARGPQVTSAASVHSERAAEWALAYAGRTESYLADTTQELDEWGARTGLSGDDFEWCGVFVHEAFWKAGVDLASEIRSTDWVYQTMSNGGSTHLQRVAINDARRGDILLIDWPNSGDNADHLALVVNDVKDSDTSVNTISGNTTVGSTRGVGFTDIPKSYIVYAIRVVS